MSKKKVLLLCTGNSCRSQMAEGIVNSDLSKNWRAFSAGTQPAGYIHPMAIQAMTELGIDISKNMSKSTEEFLTKKFDVVVTVCDDAAEECPVWLREGEVVHISFPDPASAIGTYEEKMAIFRTVRDDIRRRITYYLTNGRMLVQGEVS